MRIAIVTGASSGIGRAFVKQIEVLYKELDEIWVIARRKERLLELSSVMLTRLRVMDGDLLENTIFEIVEETLKKETPDIRMLVNAAGFGKIGKVSDIGTKEQLQMIDVNCKALMRMTLLCMPYMNEGSRILNVASAAAFCPQPSFAVYAATKSYVLSFSRALGAELKERKIGVTAVCPGPVKTEFFEIAGKNDNPMKESFMARPEKVVHQALIAAKEGKDISVYGTSMKSAEVATKLLPHKMILKVMKRFW